jgi:hypothetical protein
MQQALELFELLQARKSKEADKSVTVEAEPVVRAPERAEPLSFLTIGTVEGIIGSTSPDALQEQTSSWEGKVEKFMRLSHTYSSDNTTTHTLLTILSREKNATWWTKRCTGTFF